jgi:hypothetical protein
MDRQLEHELTRFKRARDGLLRADSAEFVHHLREFIKEVRRNQLTKTILGSLPPYDVASWWKSQLPDDWHERRRRGASLNFPEDDAAKMVVLFDLAESMASEEKGPLTVGGFGQVMGKFKMDESVAVAESLVCHPLADMLTDAVRQHVEVANPAIRVLAGVPLARIPSDDEVRIFLSHKTVNKPMVQPYYDLLAALGFSPWLDEKDLKAGDTLHREIASGFDHACAVVFFVTADFKDERWLAHEVDQAVKRRIERGADKFAIITLVFDDTAVPRSLQDYVYVKVHNPLHAMRELVRALPVQLGPLVWRK